MKSNRYTIALDKLICLIKKLLPTWIDMTHFHCLRLKSWTASSNRCGNVQSTTMDQSGQHQLATIYWKKWNHGTKKIMNVLRDSKLGIIARSGNMHWPPWHFSNLWKCVTRLSWLFSSLWWRPFKQTLSSIKVLAIISLIWKPIGTTCSLSI